MYYVYALVSLKHKRIYVGQTQDLDVRVRDHNSGRTKTIKHYKPWKVLYFEGLGTRREARNREKYFKSGIGKDFLKNVRDGKYVRP